MTNLKKMISAATLASVMIFGNSVAMAGIIIHDSARTTRTNASKCSGPASEGIIIHDFFNFLLNLFGSTRGAKTCTDSGEREGIIIHDKAGIIIHQREGIIIHN